MQLYARGLLDYRFLAVFSRRDTSSGTLCRQPGDTFQCHFFCCLKKNGVPTYKECSKENREFNSPTFLNMLSFFTVLLAFHAKHSYLKEMRPSQSMENHIRCSTIIHKKKKMMQRDSINVIYRKQPYMTTTCKLATLNSSQQTTDSTIDAIDNISPKLTFYI